MKASRETEGDAISCETDINANYIFFLAAFLCFAFFFIFAMVMIL